MTVLALTADNLILPKLAHAFFGRPGGVSTGVYAGLNCGPGSGDNRDHVIENRRRAMAVLGGAQLATLYQIHSAQAVTVTAPWEIGQSPHADAMATNRPGIALGILTADCAPVLMADAEAGVIGAAHAGWKGAIAGVTDSAIAAMESLGARRACIAAAIGPCIAQVSYEVDAGFRDRFMADAAANASFFVASDRAGHFRFDLESYVAERLAMAGVGSVTTLGADTYANEERFYSFRRATHRGESDYGRDLSAITLTR
jgi:polyphenol oxidase